jgi:hypothetical protein
VENCYAAGKTRGKTLNGLGRQGNFGNQANAFLTGSNGFSQGAKVNLGLAAASNALEQDYFRFIPREAELNGGRVFNASTDVWDALKRAGNDRAWAVNREAFQAQLERGVPRIDLTGETVSEVFSNARRATSGTADEINFLRRYGYECGYRQVGDSWVKVGDWRASTAGRTAGASVGPGLDVLEDAYQP